MIGAVGTVAQPLRAIHPIPYGVSINDHRVFSRALSKGQPLLPCPMEPSSISLNANKKQATTYWSKSMTKILVAGIDPACSAFGITLVRLDLGTLDLEVKD
jgi:hypothetical protein